MKITVRVKPNSRKPGVAALPDGSYEVRVNAPPHEGRANAAVIDALADYFGTPKSSLAILRGHSSKIKIITRKS